MTILKCTLTATAALVLAACGSTNETYQGGLTGHKAPTTAGASTGSANNNGGANTGNANNNGGTNTGNANNNGGADTGNANNNGGADTGNANNNGGADTGNANNNGGADTGNANNNGGADTGSTTPPPMGNQPTGKYTGHVASGNTALAGTLKDVAHDDLTAITIDGVRINLPTAMSTEHLPIIQTNQKSISLGPTHNLFVGKNLKHAVYGFVQDYQGLPGETRFAFAMGDETKNMPAEGHVRYEGAAAYSNDLHQGRLHGVLTGVAHPDGKVGFTVDFAGKSLSGEATLHNLVVPLNAKIQGSKFASDGKSDWEVKGAFYGPNAAEAAGTFRNLKDAATPTLGAFGAVRRDNADQSGQ